MNRLAVLNCGQLVTLAGPPSRRGGQMRDLAIVENGGVLIEGDRIVAVGHSAEIDAVGAEIIGAQGRVATPGLVDCHTHAFVGNRQNEFQMRAQGRSYEEIAAAGGGILNSVKAVRAATPAEIRASLKLHLEWCLKCGSTTVEVKSGYGLDLPNELKLLRAITEHAGSPRAIPTFLGLHAIPPEFKGNREGYVDLILNEVLPEVAKQGLAQFADIFVEQNYFTPGDAEKLAAACKQHGLKLRMHVDQLTDGNGAQLAVELGAVSAEHLEQTSAAGAKRLGESETCAVIVPASVFGLTKTTYPNGRLLIDSGAILALATDFNPGSSPTPSLPFAMTLAVHSCGLTAEEALTACTVNAAYSLGLSHEIGSLEPGKRADLVLWDVSDVAEIPYYFGAPLVHTVIAGGQPVTL
ncbi:MAG: imidazolonepropionase [Armatimonadetes bacterium]|nr:imidazolonepropionase [Armatimonadota bacterium]